MDGQHRPPDAEPRPLWRASPVTRRAAIATLAACAATSIRAQSVWPDRTITLVHGLAPGGPSDIIARIIADGLTRRLGQQVVVNSRPGAGGRVAAGQVARMAADGYTLMGIPSGHAVAAALYKSLPYRTIDDFAMISLITEYPFVVVTYADHPIRTLRRPHRYGTLAAGAAAVRQRGNGSLQHLAGELLAKTVSATFQHVPYRGSAQAITDLIARRIDFIVNSPTAELEFIRAGQLRALAVTSAERFFGLPEVPTTAEAGVPGYAFTSWQGLVAPAGVPLPVINRLNAEIAAILAEPATIERIGWSVTIRAPRVPASKARIAADIDKWTKVVDAAKIERI